MTALEDAAQAVEEAVDAALRDTDLDNIRRLIWAVRHHDAEIVRSEGHLWAGEAGRAILHTAERIDPEETP